MKAPDVLHEKDQGRAWGEEGHPTAPGGLFPWEYVEFFALSIPFPRFRAGPLALPGAPALAGAAALAGNTSVFVAREIGQFPGLEMG